MAVLDLAQLTWEEVRDLDRAKAVAILPVGAIEAHGPHLPLATDVIIAEEMARAAAARLATHGYDAVLLPPLAYTAAEFAAGFPGTVSLRPGTVTALLLDLARSLTRHGLHVLAVANARLDPAHVAALEAAVAQNQRENGTQIVFPDVTKRPWALRLTEEFRSGACHAGRYESSIVLAARPELVRDAIRGRCPPTPARSARQSAPARRASRKRAGPGRTLGRPPTPGPTRACARSRSSERSSQRRCARSFPGDAVRTGGRSDGWGPGDRDGGRASAGRGRRGRHRGSAHQERDRGVRDGAARRRTPGLGRAGRRDGPGHRGSPRARSRDAARACGHPRKQRRGRSLGTTRQAHARGLEPGADGERHRHVSVHAGLPPRDARAALGPGGEHRLGGGAPRRKVHRCLQRREARGRRLHALAGGGGRWKRCDGERGVPRVRRHGYDPGVGGAHRDQDGDVAAGRPARGPRG